MSIPSVQAIATEVNRTEATNMDNDESAQILYLINSLPPVQKRRTLLQIQTLMPSTWDEASTHNPTIEKGMVQESKVLDNTTDGNTGASSSTSSCKPETGNSAIIVRAQRNAVYPKLRTFSGIAPVPQGQVNFSTWHKAAARLCSNPELSEAEQCSLLQNSITEPALDYVQTALDSGSTVEVLQLLVNAYGTAEDPRDLLNDFNATIMSTKEKASDYLSRLYLKLEALKSMNIVSQRTRCISAVAAVQLWV